MTDQGRKARLAALERSRAATQFQPLDASSPTVLLQVKVPQTLIDRIDSARHGLSRSEYVRTAIETALGE